MDKEENKTIKKKQNNKVAIVIVLLVVLLGVGILFLTQGSTTTGQYPEDVRSESLTCVKDNIDYPFFAYDNATKKTAKIDIVFNQDKMKSIALTYSLYYNDSNSITASEAHNHAAMNKSFAASGLEADALDATYSKLKDRMQMTLYANQNSDIANLKYFLIDRDITDYNLNSYKDYYISLGFNCDNIK